MPAILFLCHSSRKTLTGKKDTTKDGGKDKEPKAEGTGTTCPDKILLWDEYVTCSMHFKMTVTTAAN